jgi:hypothetical protein
VGQLKEEEEAAEKAKAPRERWLKKHREKEQCFLHEWGKRLVEEEAKLKENGCARSSVRRRCLGRAKELLRQRHRKYVVTRLENANAGPSTTRFLY